MRSLIRRDHGTQPPQDTTGGSGQRPEGASGATGYGRPGSTPGSSGGPTVGGRPVEGSARPSWLQPEGAGATGAAGSEQPETTTTPPAAEPSAGPEAPAPMAERRSTDNTLIVGPNIKLKGEIAACDTLVVEGTIEAAMDSHHIHIAKGGVFSGKVTVDTAEVAGDFDGDLTVRDRLLVRNTGKITGTVRYGALEVENGGRLAGTLELLEGAAAASSSAPRAQAPAGAPGSTPAFLRGSEAKARPDDKTTTPPQGTGTEG